MGHIYGSDLRKNSDGGGSVLDQLMNEIYNTVTATCMIESPTKEGKTFLNDIQKDGNTSQNHMSNNDKEMAEASLQLTRSLTEKRKRYVRRVSSKVELISPLYVGSVKRNRHNSMKVFQEQSTKGDIQLSLPLKYDFNKVKAVFEQDVFNPVKSDIQPEEIVETNVNVKDRLFEACALIAMNFSTGEAYIKSVYPENAILPPQLESFVFPEPMICSNNADSSSKQFRQSKRVMYETSPEDTQTYSLVLTDERGNRTYGYCHRVVPEGAPFCLPLAYCMISSYRAPAFYYKILHEIGINHGSSEIVVSSILDQLYNEELPSLGNSIFVKRIKSPRKPDLLNGFQKNSIYRSTVNLGDMKNISSNNNSSDKVLKYNSVQLDSINKNVRRKSTDLSLKFPEIFSGENGMSMVRSLERIYGEEVKDASKKNNITLGEIKKSTANVTENCFEKEFGHKNLHKSLLSSKNTDDMMRNLRKSESSEKIPVENRTVESSNSDYNSIKLERPLVPCLEENNLSVLCDSMNVNVLVKIFGTLLIERKVILIGDKLSQLSACIEALQSILYPFIWQHTIITTIPNILRKDILDILDAPIPILAGILCSRNKSKDKRKTSDTENKHLNGEKSPKLDSNKNIAPGDIKSNFYVSNIQESDCDSSDFYEEIKASNFEEGMIIDITNGFEQILKCQGDESTLLPPVFSKKLRAALQLGSSISDQSDVQAKKSRNILIAEAFYRFFVDLLKDYKNYLNYTPLNPTHNVDGDVEKTSLLFDKERFMKCASSKHIQYFLEWFTETAMFNYFIKTKVSTQPSTSTESNVEESLPYPNFYDLFDDKITLSSKNTKNEPGSDVKNNYKMKIKTWRHKLRDLIN